MTFTLTSDDIQDGGVRRVNSKQFQRARYAKSGTHDIPPRIFELALVHQRR